MTIQEISQHGTWLRRAGLIVGVAGIMEIFIFALLNGEGGPDWTTLLPAVAFTFMSCIPLIICLIISRKWLFISGISLIVIAVIILIGISVTYFGRPSINPTTEILAYVGRAFSWIGLPYLVPGILFLLSSRQSGINKDTTIRLHQKKIATS